MIMVEELIQLLEPAWPKMDCEYVADAIWLAQFITDLAARDERDELRPKQPPRFEDKLTVPPASTPATVQSSEILPSDPTPTKTSRVKQEPVYAVTDAPQGEDPAIRRRISGAPALPDSLAISQALRPFSRRVKSKRATVLDEEMTAHRSAECNGHILPVFQPELERWLSVAIVVEDSPAMSVWKETIRELAALIEGQGAFKRVSRWRLRLREGQARLFTISGVERDSNALNGPAGRQLIILLSDGVASCWADGSMASVLSKWAATCSIVVGQVLSERLWTHTALGKPSARVKVLWPGSPNSRLIVERPWWDLVFDEEDEEDDQDADKKENDRDAGKKKEDIPLTLPVVALNRELIEEWVCMLTQPGSVYKAVLLSPSPNHRMAAPLPSSQEVISPEQRVERFYALVSTDAYRLAIYVSLMPLTLPVMRLVQAAMLPSPSHEQIAELLLGGIIKRKRPIIPSANQDGETSDNLDDEGDAEYEFYPGVNEILERQFRRTELIDVIRYVSEYIAEQTGSPFEIETLIGRPEGKDVLPAGAKPFADTIIPALERLGAKDVFRKPVVEAGKGQSAGKHLTAVGHLSVGQTVKAGNLKVELSPYRFETVTLDNLGRVTNRRSGTAWQFVEDLGGEAMLEMVEIPGGTFLMGAPESEKDSMSREWPQHPVKLSPFFIGKFTVTQKQWRIVAGWPEIDRRLFPDPGLPKHDDFPVQRISWEQAEEFCRRLSAKTGKKYRLPTEAEWEYACRARTETPFAFGETISSEFVNYDGNHPYSKLWRPNGVIWRRDRYRKSILSVGNLRVANAWGIYDMHGNVHEWCSDYYGGYSADAADNPQGPPQAPPVGEHRIIRGGSWTTDARVCRSASRSGVRQKKVPDNNIGFRIAISAGNLLIINSTREIV